jgi:hypothetical protein
VSNALQVDSQPILQGREYTEEFVSKVELLLGGLLSREALQNEGKCGRCSQEQHARWRYNDCSLGVQMYRRCMRHTHMDMPLHRIKYWTGKFFCATSLWKVSNYILIPHYPSGGSLCNELSFQKHTLKIYQREKDDVEQCKPLNAASSAASAAFHTEWVGFDTSYECANKVNDEERRHPDDSEENEIEEVDDNVDDDL